MEKYIKLISPIDNKEISLIKPVVAKYIKSQYEKFKHADMSTLIDFQAGDDVYNFCRHKKKDISSKAITFKFETNIENGDKPFEIIIFDKGNFTKIIHTINTSIKVGNLVPNKTYFWYVKFGQYKSIEHSFKLSDSYRLAHTNHIWNVRDCGGKQTIDNKMMKYGLLFRGPELTRKKYVSRVNRDDFGNDHFKVVTNKDVPHLYDLGFKVELDLRGDIESMWRTKCSISTNDNYVKYVRIPIGAYQEFFIDVFTPEGKIKIQKIFDLLSNADKEPVYVHCWGGADRTGTICFILEAILGVKLVDLVIDYELTGIEGNMTRAKDYDANKDPFFREKYNFSNMCRYLIRYSNEGETIQDTVIRFLINEARIKPEIIAKIQSIFLTECN